MAVMPYEKTFQTVKVENRDRVTTITLNRPEKKNAMSPQMHFEMVDILRDLKYDDNTRVLIITGAGDAFCAGQDLKEYFWNNDDDPVGRGRSREASEEWRALRLRLFPKPTIAAINGYCFGGAFTIVASCDFAIAAEDALFGLSEVNFGKLPGGHVTKIVNDLFHPRDALYYIMTGKPFDGRKAAEVKFVTMAVPRERLWDEVNELASTLKEKNPVVLQMAKEAYKYGRDMNYEEAGAWLWAKSEQLDYRAGKTWKQGVAQFKSKEFRPGLGHYDWRKEGARTPAEGGAEPDGAPGGS